jgi:hypothetical protein
LGRIACRFLTLPSRAAWNSGAAREDFERISAAYPLSFYMHLKDPHAHWVMIEG